MLRGFDNWAWSDWVICCDDIGVSSSLMALMVLDTRGSSRVVCNFKEGLSQCRHWLHRKCPCRRLTSKYEVGVVRSPPLGLLLSWDRILEGENAATACGLETRTSSGLMSMVVKEAANTSDAPTREPNATLALVERVSLRCYSACQQEDGLPHCNGLEFRVESPSPTRSWPR